MNGFGALTMISRKVEEVRNFKFKSEVIYKQMYNNRKDIMLVILLIIIFNLNSKLNRIENYVIAL